MIKRLLFQSWTRNLCTQIIPTPKRIIIEKIGYVTTIGINRPEKRNCIDSNTAKLLEGAISAFEEDSSSYAAVVYGTGGNFCSGHDLQEIENLESNNENEWDVAVLPSKKYISKPMVAALSGYTVGLGLELALLCDLRVMEETAVIGLYGRRFGIPLMDGGSVRLPAIIGLSRALDLILTGRSLTAKEAFDWGLANRIVACGAGLGQAIQLATSLVKFPQDCLRIDRNSTYFASFNRVYDELLENEKTNAKKVELADLIEGAKKFMGGIGKHGKFYNLKEKEVFEWEKQFTNTAKSKL
ncbi:hypothetical protein GWI33_022876 [Rhynchophorus ferrugineus]|uniref:Enoyl-CoA hydratase n=1 Tax=Rhynchophorus ferrugineus TaxID=354439 RepID=A0A834IMK0_RHYFE|nr:hypothetical protein GWI33_022876 [Rhynchophorus ferrugineus]